MLATGYEQARSVVAMMAVVMFGGASGMMTLERVAITVEWFGRDSFGARSGRIASVVFVARALSPFAVEVLHRWMTYPTVFAVLAAIVAIGSAVVQAATRLHDAGLARLD